MQNMNISYIILIPYELPVNKAESQQSGWVVPAEHRYGSDTGVL